MNSFTSPLSLALAPFLWLLGSACCCLYLLTQNEPSFSLSRSLRSSAFHCISHLPRLWQLLWRAVLLALGLTYAGGYLLVDWRLNQALKERTVVRILETSRNAITAFP